MSGRPVHHNDQAAPHRSPPTARTTPPGARHGLLALQRSAGNRAVVALVAGARPVVQRDAKTAAQALWDAKKNGVFVSDFTEEFNKAHGVTRTDQAAIKKEFAAIKLANATPAKVTGTVTKAELGAATSGNSGGQSYHPSGASTPHMSVEWTAPASAGGLYTIKKFHYKVRSDGGYFWWNSIVGGKASFHETTGLKASEKTNNKEAANKKAALLGPLLNCALDPIP